MKYIIICSVVLLRHSLFGEHSGRVSIPHFDIRDNFLPHGTKSSETGMLLVMCYSKSCPSPSQKRYGLKRMLRPRTLPSVLFMLSRPWHQGLAVVDIRFLGVPARHQTHDSRLAYHPLLRCWNAGPHPTRYFLRYLVSSSSFA